MLDSYPIADLNREVTRIYAEVDAYSQNKSKQLALPPDITARNMGKNDIWIAAITLYLDMTLHTLDNDFNHLSSFGLRVVKPAT